ncbi:LLM class flavin-dependent oxidoreductase [Microbispora corallina]|uniref:Alkanal monooxygenase n=1 Tax=Microbispora corallina TaxID=83302 RepID=A0ABQ4G9Q1_9ACTN|nr:LLM class flavin-dependent oxidoreductase [Microbispora corallina]GIH43698.1 alkanal monooxygenase [Microbispora corallina]
MGVFLIAAGFPGTDPGDVLRHTVEVVEAAERAGFDDAWIAEHHFMTYGVCPSAVTLAAVALGRTSRITVGTAVSVLPAQHPVALAEQAAVLHHASGGRFRLGVGRGGPWLELEVFGTGLARYERGFPEALDLLCEALSGRPVSADGDFFRFREVPVVPPARMSPVVACTSDATARLAARRGLPMLLGMHVGDEEKADMVARYDEGREGVGRPPHLREEDARPAHIAAAVCHVADSTARAVRELKEALPRWLEPGLAGYVPVDGRPRPRRDVPAYVDLLCRIHPVGSPEHCVEKMRATVARTGLRHLVLMVEGTGSPARTLETVARLGAEVLPALRSA